MNRFFVTTAAAALFLSAHNAVAGDAELVDAMLHTSATTCDDLGVERDRLLEVVAALKAEIVSELQGGRQVQLDNFGTFYLDRLATAVQTGTKSTTPVREVVRFKARNAEWMTREQPKIAEVSPIANP